MAWDTEFLELMPDTITVKPELSFDGYGEPTYSTSTTTLQARVVYKPEMVTSFEGEEVISVVKAWVASTSVLSTVDQYVLPDGSTPPLIQMERYPDEDGLHHIVLHFGGR